MAGAGRLTSGRMRGAQRGLLGNGPLRGWPLSILGNPILGTWSWFLHKAQVMVNPSSIFSTVLSP